jgi:hypothetical protein
MFIFSQDARSIKENAIEKGREIQRKEDIKEFALKEIKLKNAEKYRRQKLRNDFISKLKELEAENRVLRKERREVRVAQDLARDTLAAVKVYGNLVRDFANLFGNRAMQDSQRIIGLMGKVEALDRKFEKNNKDIESLIGPKSSDLEGEVYDVN